MSFGFGGKLVTFCSKDASVGASEVCLIGCSVLLGSLSSISVGHCLHSFQVYVHNLASEHSLVGHSSELEAAIRNGERPSLRLLCDKKIQESEYVLICRTEFFFFSFIHVLKWYVI